MENNIMENKYVSSYNQDFVNKLKTERKNKIKNLNISRDDKINYLKKLADSNKEQQIYAKGLVENANYTIEAQVFFTDFLKRDIITDDERTWYYTLDEPLTDNESKVYEISNHGQPPREAIVMERDVVRITPYWITSPEVSMHKFSLRQGDISNEEKMRKRANKGITWDVEDDVTTLLENGLINDITSVDGIDIDDRIKTYPSSTDIDLSAEEGITINVLKSILKHFTQMGMMVETVYVPVDNLTDLWDWMSLPATHDYTSVDNVAPQVLVNQIIKTGTINNIFGYPVNLAPVNTLNGDKTEDPVYIWAKTNQPCGEYRVFPKLGFPYNHEDARRIYYQINRAQAMFQTPVQRMNYARFKIDED